MKKAILTTIFAIIASAAASQTAFGTTCILSKENPQIRSQFDQIVYSSNGILSEGATYQMIMIKEDGKIVDNFELKREQSLSDLLPYHNASYAWISRATDGSLLLQIGQVDLSNPNQIFKVNSTVMGDSSKGIATFDPVQKLALYCVNQ
jgi:hypothetical protein